jgi:hypothetical protein
MKQLYHNGIPLATQCLQLLFEFDISLIENWKSLCKKDHHNAAIKACVATNVDASKVACRAHEKNGPIKLNDVQSLPRIDDSWCNDDNYAIKIEFLYSTNLPQLGVRVLVNLSLYDGVSGARIALHTLEVLESPDYLVGSTKAIAFKVNPPFTFGLKQISNFVQVIGHGHISAYNPFTYEVSPSEIATPMSGSSLRAYYSQENPKPAVIQYYAPEGSGKEAFKRLLTVAQQWKDRVGWSGFFVLLNFPPGVSASIVTNAADLNNIEKRYDGIFVPISQPPGNEGWIVNNYVHINYNFFNNYGVHVINSRAIAKAFVWDWLGVCAPVCGFGCISINDKLLIWIRWTEKGVKDASELFNQAFGEPIGSGYQSPV